MAAKKRKPAKKPLRAVVDPSAVYVRVPVDPDLAAAIEGHVRTAIELVDALRGFMLRGELAAADVERTMQMLRRRR